MKKLVVIAAVVFAACNSKPETNQPYVEERATVSTEPVKEYSFTDADSAKFKVQLFEQKKSLNYEVKFSYKEAASEKIITLPNMGIMPKPELKKGANDLSCIIGFYDADSIFMEYRLVNVEKGLLGYKHLKEYQVEQPKK
ncbi:hypothetical protein ESA94_13180 [Lacibacter luteus]|uniref:Lipoprotein n=1 Tax=Lacibacter luteus TaxID=2508719 RepID=A0A4Q1CIP6_9BACT|nr:hypothetical protein [Lacibacter luteus]RXK59995.1 hypothetical protein ESA94_13180 [Lacibacter luteus]